MTNRPLVKMFGLDFQAVTLKQAAMDIAAAGRNRHNSIVVTPNVDHVVMLQDDKEMRDIYQRADFVYADGMPVVWTSRFSGGARLPERVTGADLLFEVCALAAKQSLKVVFVGGMPGIADQARLSLGKLYPGLNVVGCYCPPFGFENSEQESQKIIDFCNRLQPDIMFIGVGAPKQEKWAAKHMARLDVGPILCVGAAFDFAAGHIKRAPALVQRCGMEWAWRLASEPGRLWRRYLLRDSKFLGIALREILAARR